MNFVIQFYHNNNYTTWNCLPDKSSNSSIKSSVNNGGNFLEKKSFSAVATALTGMSRFVTFMSLSENNNNSN